MTDSTLLADLTLMYLGRLVTVKGDEPGHPFRGNQYGHGSGDAPQQVGGRAPKGGAIGPNSEYYKGGAFVANTTLPKMTPQDKKKKKYANTKQEIAPGTYDLPPSPDHFSIYRASGVGAMTTLDRPTGMLKRNEAFRGMEGRGYDFTKQGAHGFSTDELIGKFNSGERWTLPKGS